MIRGRHLTPLLFFFILAGCLVSPAGSDVFYDLRDLPQDVTAYLGPDAAARDLPLWPDQEALAADYLARHYAPWEGGAWLRPRSEAFWSLAWVKGSRAFGENRQPLPRQWLDELIRQTDADRYPSLDLRAITVRAVYFRTLPTRRPAFRDPNLPGEGFPFDYVQNGAAPAGTPLRIRHRSLDGAWVYAEAPGDYGWLPAEEIAYVDSEFVARFRQSRLVVLVDDGAVIFDRGGIFRFGGRIGTFLPLIDTLPEGHLVWIAAADADRRAVLRQALLPEGAAAPFPLPATTRQIAAVANRMLGQPYGWGGMYGNRDCSALLRDLFSPFGLWLPRNSARQAEAGQLIPLEALAPEEKERVLLRTGVPLRTLVWLNGHIMLYLGEYRGRAAVLHALWGVRTRTAQGEEGRRVIGRTVITTLQPGLELAELARPEGDLRSRIKGMTLLGPPVQEVKKKPGRPDAKKRG